MTGRRSSVPADEGGFGPGIAGVVHHNIRTLAELREQMARAESVQDRFAHRISRFVGSMLFVYSHAFVIVSWILINSRAIPVIEPFDPYPFAMLAMIASVEAIFITTFVLITQNRMDRISEKRAELDLQINLLTEHEVTRLIHLVDAIADHLGVEAEMNTSLEDLKQDVGPGQVLDEIEKVEREVDETSE